MSWMEWIYPRRCILCDKVIPEGTCCIQCGEKQKILQFQYEIMDCKWIQQYTAVYWYVGPIRKAVLDCKFHDQLYHKRQFIECIVQKLKLTNKNFDCILAIPSYRGNHNDVNLSHLLAKGISRQLKIPYLAKALIKVKQTQKQHDLPYEQRRHNLLNCFQADQQLVQGKHILLVDDIITTGSTLAECAKVLYQSGASSVFSAVFAATPPKNYNIMNLLEE